MSRVGGKKKLSRLNNPWRSVPSAAKKEASACASASLCVHYSGCVEKARCSARSEQKVRGAPGIQRTEKRVPVRDRTACEMGEGGADSTSQRTGRMGVNR